jgi:hypothetical protein
VDLKEGALWRNRYLLEGPVCVFICFTFAICRKNKNHCLEMSVNNSWLLEKLEG